jgi:hypothetical protein
MAFPSSPTNNQTATVNGILYIYSSANRTWTRQAVQAGEKTTTSATAPTNPGPGDVWYNSTNDTILTYMFDGANWWWVDRDGPTFGTGNNIYGNASITGNLVVGGNLQVTGNVTTVNYETILYTETANILTANSITVSGNITAGNVIATTNYGNVVATTATYSGNVGIGTTSPADLLTLDNQSASSTAGLSLYSSGILDARIYSNSANLVFNSLRTNPIAWQINSSTVMTLNGSGQLGIGTTSPAVSLDISARTDAISMPIGTTAQRPGTLYAGMHRYNSSTNSPEWYSTNTSTWQPMAQQAGYLAQIFALAGGGGGGGGESNPGGDGGGGGGGGGIVNTFTTLAPGTSYSVIVGGGGAGGTPGASGSGNGVGTPGGNSVFGYTSTQPLAYAFGGGAGGDGNQNPPTPGGSGGGAGNQYSVNMYGAGPVYGQGYAGGDAAVSNTSYRGGSGGGGAGGPGTVRTSNNGANGGSPTYVGIAGAMYTTSGAQPPYYGGGGGGGPCGTGSAGTGSNGVVSNGGNGATTTVAATAGTASTGTGGGGGVGQNVATTYYYGAAGGSGVVIISYQSTSQKGTGGTVTSYAPGPNGLTYWVHTFTSSGTYTA